MLMKAKDVELWILRYKCGENDMKESTVRNIGT